MQAATHANGKRQEKPHWEDALVETFRRKVREAAGHDAVGEMNVRVLFNKGGVHLKQVRIGMKIEYEFVHSRSD